MGKRLTMLSSILMSLAVISADGVRSPLATFRAAAKNNVLSLNKLSGAKAGAGTNQHGVQGGCIGRCFGLNWSECVRGCDECNPCLMSGGLSACQTECANPPQTDDLDASQT